MIKSDNFCYRKIEKEFSILEAIEKSQTSYNDAKTMKILFNKFYNSDSNYYFAINYYCCAK